MRDLKKISALVVVCFTISLLWCDSSICDNIAAADRSVTTQCGAQGDSQDIPVSSPRSDSCGCACTCHIPTVVENISEPIFIPSIETVVTFNTSRTILVPGKMVFRPPLTV